jgi:hypothetical protein
MPKETLATEGMRRRYADHLRDCIEEFYKNGNVIDLAFLADAMFLHVHSREGELLSDAILRHLGLEEEGGAPILPKSSPPGAADSTASNQGCSIRLNKAALDRIIRRELATNGLDQIAEHFQERATAEELALMYALMNTKDKSLLEVLQDLLVWERKQPAPKGEAANA